MPTFLNKLVGVVFRAEQEGLSQGQNSRKGTNSRTRSNGIHVN